MQSQSLQSLIQFYNHQQPFQNTSTLSSSSSSSSSSSLSKHTSEPSSSHSKDTSEDCYQVDSDQWSTLGLPHPKPTPDRNSIIHPPAIQKPIRQQSMPVYPPPVPPRKTRNASGELLTKQSSQEQRNLNHNKIKYNQDNYHHIHHEPIMVKHQDVDKKLVSIDLNQFRKSIQALWFTLLNQNSNNLMLNSNTPHAHYYDHLGRKILLPGSIIRLVWMRSGLPLCTLSLVWDSIDKEKMGWMNFEEFLLGMYEISKLRQDKSLMKEAETQVVLKKSEILLKRRMREGRTSVESKVEMRQNMMTPTRRRTPPLVPSSRSGSVSSSSSSSTSSESPFNDIQILDPFLSVQSESPIQSIHPFFDLSSSPTPCSEDKKSNLNAPVFHSFDAHASLLI